MSKYSAATHNAGRRTTYAVVWTGQSTRKEEILLRPDICPLLCVPANILRNGCVIRPMYKDETSVPDGVVSSETGAFEIFVFY
jgi:hypothetical protein